MSSFRNALGIAITLHLILNILLCSVLNTTRVLQGLYKYL